MAWEELLIWLAMAVTCLLLVKALGHMFVVIGNMMAEHGHNHGNETQVDDTIEDEK